MGWFKFFYFSIVFFFFFRPLALFFKVCSPDRSFFSILNFFPTTLLPPPPIELFMEGESLLVFQTHQTLRLFCFHILTTPSTFTNDWNWMKMNANGCKRINRCKMMIDEDFVEKGFTWTNLINLILFKKYYNIWNGALLSHIKVSLTQSIIDLDFS